MAAISKLIPNLRKGSCIVTLLPDRGERYLDTVYDPDWPALERRLTRPFAASFRRLGERPALAWQARRPSAAASSWMPEAHIFPANTLSEGAAL